jgi:branched-subunit amino acid permease
VGVGKGFALQEAFDQIGAFIGPIILFLVFLLLISKKLYPTPGSLNRTREAEGKLNFEPFLKL